MTLASSLKAIPTSSNNAETKSVSILGSTGSVGCSTVEIVSHHPDRFRIVALTANTNVEKLAEQARALRPELCVISDPSLYSALQEALHGEGIEVAAGRDALIDAARRPSDFLMAAIVGAAGLEPTLAAVERGAQIGFANKECLVSAGSVMTKAVADFGATLLPVDSEHNAIFQVYDSDRTETIARILLTGSGGPFRTADIATMKNATPAQAIAHPNWSMGQKISVDSATMMNKGLELIEAHHLFPLSADRIEILIHPQSVIHSMVEYVDGSVLAQLGSPDMKTPIAHALAWPGRVSIPAERIDFHTIKDLTFEAPDETRFPSLRLAREAIDAGSGSQCAMNAANEIAVRDFLNESIGFLDIPAIVEETMTRMGSPNLATLADVLELDLAARHVATDISLSRR